MKHILLFIILAGLVSGCTKGDKSQSGDLGAFIVERSQSFGAHPNTTGLPVLHADWKYNQTSDVIGRKVRIMLDGDHTAELKPFLTSAFGSPKFPIKTIDAGFVIDIFGADGVAVEMSGGNDKDGKRYTRIAIEGPPAP